MCLLCKTLRKSLLTPFLFSPCYLASGIAEALYHHESESLDWLVAAVAAQLSTPATSVTINLKLCQCRDHPALGGNNQTKYLSLCTWNNFWSFDLFTLCALLINLKAFQFSAELLAFLCELYGFHSIILSIWTIRFNLTHPQVDVNR